MNESFIDWPKALAVLSWVSAADLNKYSYEFLKLLEFAPVVYRFQNYLTEIAHSAQFVNAKLSPLVLRDALNRSN